MDAAPRVGVVGSANVDLVVRCPALPRPGETVLAGDVSRLAGGKGANQAAAAARLGAAVTFHGAVGDDEAGRWLLESLRSYGVDVARVARVARPTGTAFITLDAAGENQIVVAPGANGSLDLANVDLHDYAIVLTQLEIAPEVVADVVARAPRVVLNAAPAVALDPAVLARADVVIVNETEAEALDLARLDHVVVTLGADGAERRERGRVAQRVAAPPVTPVDTVGAGDVFCAAYTVALARAWSPDEALAYATHAGALATLALGAQGALPTDQEVTTWLARASS